MNFYEKQLKRMFPDFDTQSDDTIFAGKAMLSIINKHDGVIDSQAFMFHEIVGLKGPKKDQKPHVWDDNGKPDWFVYEPTTEELEQIGSKVEDYVLMYADHELGIQM